MRLPIYGYRGKNSSCFAVFRYGPASEKWKISFVVHVADELEGKCRGGGGDNQCDEEQHGFSPLLSLAFKYLNNAV